MAEGCGYFKTSFDADMAIFDTRFRRFWLYVLFVAIAIYPWLVPSYYVTLANLVWLSMVGALALNLLIGYAGQVSLGQAAFLAVGAYVSVFLTLNFGLSMWLATPLAGLAAALIGLAVGMPSLRFKGFYLALTTLALHFLITYVAQKYQLAAGGREGFALPEQSAGPIAFATDYHWYYLLCLVAIITVVAATNIVRTKAGRAWVAIRDRDIAAAIIGIDVARYKLLAFATSAALTGIAGSLQAYYLHHVSIEAFTLVVAVQYVAMIIIGGLGSIVGSIFGAVFVTLLPFVIASLVRGLPAGWPLAAQLQGAIFDVQSGVFGLAITLFLLLEPRGMVVIWDRIKAWVQLWPYQRKHVATVNR